MPNGKPTSISFDSTIKAAALNGDFSPDGSLRINERDVREKVFERKTGVTMVFVVDASGSMGARKRMSAVKGAMLSILTDAYQKRDRVSLISFRSSRADVLVPPTNSIDLAQKRMTVMPTGGKTPLAHGLYLAERVILAEKAKHPKDLYLMVLVSDGRGNVPLNGNNASQDTLKVAQAIADDKIRCLVLDTESGAAKLGLAKKLADTLCARYMRLEDIDSDSIRIATKSTTRS